MASPAVNVPLAAGLIKAAPAIYRGLTVRETAGAAATVRLFDNASAGSGTLIATVALAANTDRDIELTEGTWSANGIFAVITGTVEGSVRIG